jgi:undecaprenyl-diphosphatase
MAVSRNLWGFIERRDHRVMRRMNRWRAPRWIRYWMIAATRAGDGWLWYGLGIMLLITAGRSGMLRWKLRAPPGLAASSYSKS